MRFIKSWILLLFIYSVILLIKFRLWLRIQQAELRVHTPQPGGIFFSFLFLYLCLLPLGIANVWTKAPRHLLVLFVLKALFDLLVVFHAIRIISSGTFSISNFLTLRFLPEWPSWIPCIFVSESFFEDLFAKSHGRSTRDDVLTSGTKLLVYLRVVSTKRSPGWRIFLLFWCCLSSDIRWNLRLLTRAWFRVNALDSIFLTHERWLLLSRRWNRSLMPQFYNRRLLQVTAVEWKKSIFWQVIRIRFELILFFDQAGTATSLIFLVLHGLRHAQIVCFILSFLCKAIVTSLGLIWPTLICFLKIRLAIRRSSLIIQ